ncbi:hypothetical protein J5W49_03890 [Candidatus Akkermansia timonensis]|nr:hypothetical protein [Candidatus Akkermansia timonensis]QWO96702.1 hypothetical protein J5W49_03890 [Candidatus Akkermansia timonensis]
MSLPGKTGGLPSGGILEREVLRPQRGRIMDANEEILTNNMHSSILVADGYHLSDPKVISYALAYSKAVHSPLWAETKTEKDQEKLVSGFRRKILNQAASKKKRQQGIQPSKNPPSGTGGRAGRSGQGSKKDGRTL